MENKAKASTISIFSVTGESLKPSKAKNPIQIPSGVIMKKKVTPRTSPQRGAPKHLKKPHIKMTKRSKSPVQDFKNKSNTQKTNKVHHSDKNLAKDLIKEKAIKMTRSQSKHILPITLPRVSPAESPRPSPNARKHLSTGNIVHNLHIESMNKVRKKFFKKRGYAKSGSMMKQRNKKLKNSESREIFTAVQKVSNLHDGFNSKVRLNSLAMTPIHRKECEDNKDTFYKTTRAARFGFGKRFAHPQYDEFKQTLIMTEKRIGHSRESSKLYDHKFLASIKSASQLDDLLDPSKKVFERDKKNEEDFTDLFKDKDFDLNDKDLEETLLNDPESQTIESIRKYMTIMLGRHLKFNNIEEQEILKRKVEDLDLNSINEHFVSKKVILSKAFDTYIKFKSNFNHYEADFIKNAYTELKGILEFFIDITLKLRKTNEGEYNKNQDLIRQNNNFLDAVNAVKQMNRTQNLDYYLFGIKRLTEQKYFSIMHTAKQSLKVANHELAYRQIKFLDEFFEYLITQQKQSESDSKKIQEMEDEIASLKRTLKETEKTKLEEIQGMLKFSDEQKRKIDGLNAHKTNHLEELFENRKKEFEQQKKNSIKERNRMIKKLVKIKNVVAALKEENENLKKQFIQHRDEIEDFIKEKQISIADRIRKDKKMSMSRPREPHFNLKTIFSKYIENLKSDPFESVQLKGEVQSERWALSIINLIYLDKTKKDTEDFMVDGRPLITLQQYIIQWFCVVFGNREIVNELIHDFIRTCIEFEPEYQRFGTFLNLAGVHIHGGEIDQIPASKKEKLRRIQFQSSDTLLMFLRFLMCIRLNCSPYLPDLEKENREEKGAVVSYAEAKHVWLALVNETSSEHGVTDSDFKELDTICADFLEDSSGKKNMFKIPGIVLSKTALKESRKESESDVRKSKKSYSVKSFEDKNINLDTFMRICINQYVENRILQMERLLSCLQLDQTKNSTEVNFKNLKNAIKSTWNEKAKKTSDHLLFSSNKIEMAYTHILKEMRSATFDEEDVIIKLAPFLNCSFETRAFSQRYKSKAQVKELLEKEIIDVSPPEKEESKNLAPAVSKLSGLSGLVGKNNPKEVSTKAGVNIPKSIIPTLKEFKDSTSSEILYEEITKTYKNKVGPAPLIFFMMESTEALK
ncbi:unnamed protein product [Moneuplotes crassus]|uniref:Uncharacterized protein n=1 Tax=Euplotes crassus TaxID=5936 RepID=A0AAD1XGE3_EUPCR|nr:unnamed protein product [Moneuplotes crassus]